MNKESVAYQRGKRSCTLTDLSNKGKLDGGKTIAINKNMKKSVGMPIKSLNDMG